MKITTFMCDGCRDHSLRMTRQLILDPQYNVAIPCGGRKYDLCHRCFERVEAFLTGESLPERNIP